MYVCMYVCMNVYKYGYFSFHKARIKTGLRLLNCGKASIYLKVSGFKKMGPQKTYHHIDEFYFKTFSKVRKASFCQFQLFRKACSYFNKII